MKLSEYRGEDALDLLADILEPTAIIFADRKIWEIAKGGRMIDGIKYAIKTHKHEIIEILAAMDGVPVAEYECNILALPIRVFDILNDEELKDFFTSQLQSMESSFSGVAMGNTEGTDGK